MYARVLSAIPSSKNKTMMRLKEKAQKIEGELKSSLGVSNVMQLPKLVKVVISTATGSQKDKKRNELIVDRLSKIVGQKPSKRVAKKSIAGFKMREGDLMGFAVTLRGERMYAFLDKFFNIALPRMRDFRGIDSKIVDALGNMTIGVKEHTIFPETADEDLKDVFGFAVTFVTTAKSKEDALKFFTLLGVPFKK